MEFFVSGNPSELRDMKNNVTNGLRFIRDNWLDRVVFPFQLLIHSRQASAWWLWN
jgi:hypothetical protein